MLCFRSVSAVPLTLTVILLHWCLCCALGASRLFLLLLLSFCSTGACGVLQKRLGCSSYSYCHFAPLVSVLCYRSVSAVPLTLTVSLLHWCLCCATGASRLFLLLLLSFCSTGVCVVLQERLGCSSYSYCHFAPLVPVLCYRSISAVPLTLAVILLHWCLCCATGASRLFLLLLLSFCSTGVCVVLQEHLGCSSYSCRHSAPLVSVLCYRSISAVPLTLAVILLHWCLCCATGASRLFLLLLLSFCSPGVCVVLQEHLGCSSYSYCHFAPLVSVLCYRSVSAVSLTILLSFCSTGACVVLQEHLGCSSYSDCHFAPLVSVLCYRSVSAVSLTILLSFCSTGACVVLQERLGCSSYSYCHSAPLVSVLCYRSISAVPLTLAVILLPWCLCCATGASRLFLLLLLSFCSPGVCVVLQERLGCSSYSYCHFSPLVSVLCYRSVSAVPLTLAVILLHWCLCCATGASRLFLLLLLSFCFTAVCGVL